MAVARLFVSVKFRNCEIEGRFIKLCSRNVTKRISHNNNNSSRLCHTLTSRCLSVWNERRTHCLNSWRWSSRHEQLVSVLQKCTSVQEQIEKLYETLRLTAEDFEDRKGICKTVEDVLKPFYPKCHIHLVGSSVNGFGTKGCDVDMSLQTGCPTEMMSECEFVWVPKIEDVKNGTFPLEELYCLPPKVQLLFIRQVLEEYCPDCKDLHCLSGRCRIIDFTHAKHKLKCDLAFNNQLSFYSSKLLHFYGKLDMRVPLLLVFLNYWSKRATLAGGPIKFKSYAFYLLMIYFLQTRSPPVVPTVDYLLSKSDFFKSDEAWDYEVSPDIGKIEPSKNTQSAEELLKEFFFFYLYFDFMKAIRPLSGTSVDQMLLGFRDELGNKLELSSICVEDPFDVDWNVTCGVHYKYSKSFIRNLLVNCRLYQDETLWSPSSNDWGILQLLKRNAVQDLNSTSDSISFQIQPTFQCVHNLERDSSTLGFQDTPVRDRWLQTVSQAVLRVLEYGFLFRCTALGKKEAQFCHNYASESRDLRRKSGIVSSQCHSVSYNVGGMKELENSESDDGMVLRLYCVAQNTLHGREECRKQLYPSGCNSENVLEEEHAISVKIREQKQSCDEKKFAFFCECSEVVNSELPVLNITLRSIDRTAFPQILAIFLKEYMPNIVKRVI